MITQKQAEQLVYEEINRFLSASPDMPEMVIRRIEERPLGWVIYYTTRRHQETGDSQYMLIGGAPYFVSSEDGTLYGLGPVPLIQKKILEVERKLQEGLRSKKTA